MQYALERLAFTVSHPLSGKRVLTPTCIFNDKKLKKENKFPPADQGWHEVAGATEDGWYTVTQQHVCLQSSLSIRSGGRKIDLFSTWQLPSIRCEPGKGRHRRDQTGLLSVASTLSHTWLSPAGSNFAPNIWLGHTLWGMELVPSQHTLSLTIYRMEWDLIHEVLQSGIRNHTFHAFTS